MSQSLSFQNYCFLHTGYTFQPKWLDEKASAAICNALQPLHKANEHLKGSVCISTWSKKLPLYHCCLLLDFSGKKSCSHITFEQAQKNYQDYSYIKRQNRWHYSKTLLIVLHPLKWIFKKPVGDWVMCRSSLPYQGYLSLSSRNRNYQGE